MALLIANKILSKYGPTFRPCNNISEGFVGGLCKFMYETPLLMADGFTAGLWVTTIMVYQAGNDKHRRGDALDIGGLITMGLTIFGAPYLAACRTLWAADRGLLMIVKNIRPRAGATSGVTSNGSGRSIWPWRWK